MAFKKAIKSATKLRAALFGPSGSGKTFSALAIASGMGSKIALIDSERSSASKYADRFSFDSQDLDEKNIAEYIAYIAEAGKAGYEVLIIDSLSHAWQELLADIDALAKAKYKGNTWSAWSEGTPKQRKLIDAILSFPGHVIATMRSKTEWEITKDERTGKSAPTRIGLAPEQGKGIEYEFDLLLEISPEHIANVIKDRTGKFQDKLIEKPGKDFGSQLAAWLNEGAAIPQEPPKAKPAKEPTFREKTLAEMKGVFEANGFTEAEIAFYRADVKGCGEDENKLADLLEDVKKCAEAKKTSKPMTAEDEAAADKGFEGTDPETGKKEPAQAGLMY